MLSIDGNVKFNYQSWFEHELKIEYFYTKRSYLKHNSTYLLCYIYLCAYGIRTACLRELSSKHIT